MAGTVVGAALLVATTACSSGSCAGFAVSLTSDVGGRPSPVAAAEDFAGQGTEEGLPGSGWHEAVRDGTGVLLRSGEAQLHAVQGPDGTWQVDAGQQC